MPELDQLFEPPLDPGPGDLQVLEGELVVRDDGRYVKVDDDAVLWGPVVGGDTFAHGDQVLIAVSQTGRPWVIASDG